MSNLFNKVFFSLMDDLSEEEKQQLMDQQGAADVVRRETLAMFDKVASKEVER